MMEMTLWVSDVDDTVPDIRSLTLAAGDGGQLPSFPPGSHLVVHCGPVVNAYSLTGSGVRPTSYRISVRRVGTDEGGLGGSAWIHDRLRPGDQVQVEAPRSAFPPIRHARRHLFFAAGIGITPILSHVRSAVRWGSDFEVIYLHRLGRGAHVGELRGLAGGRLRTFTERADFVGDLQQTLRGQPIGTHLYLCGPAAFMELVQASAFRCGWPAGRVHSEHFGTGVLDPGEPFQVMVNGRGERVSVPSGVSLLSALELAGHRVPNMCRKGVCGECRITVDAGEIDHRDLFMDDHDKSAGTSMLCCVSRAIGPSLEVRV